MAEGSEVKEGGGGKGGFIVVMLLLAVLGGGAGAGFSMTFLGANGSGNHGKDAVADAGAGKQAAKGSHGAGKPGEGSSAPGKGAEKEVPKDQAINLDPILVTLAGPQRSWARLELGVLIEPVEKEDPTPLLKTVSESIMSFLRTVPLAHIESSSGLEYLREDLSEIARLRSKGRMRGVILRSLVVE